MKQTITVLLIVLAAFTFNGCGAIAALVVNTNTDKMLDYNTSAKNQSVLKAYSKEGYRINIGHFTDASESEKTVKCRLMTSVEPPKNETYVAYIEHAFQKELTSSKLYKSNAKVTIVATINEINGISTYGNAYWSFDITLKSSNGESYRVMSKFEYNSSISAAYACADMHKTFPLALQKLIHDAITDPKFRTLLQKSKK